MSASKRKELEDAIAALETQRSVLGDAVVDASITALRQQLDSLEPQSQQRKLVTVLFMDIVSSTTIVLDLDPEDNMAIMDTALQRLSAPVGEHGGHVTRYMGDGFKAVFGTPVARENDPEMAVRAGLGILAAAGEYARQVETEWGVRDFMVRVGINTGLAVIGGYSEAEDTIMGTVVNLAARLESAAQPGTILISHNTYQHIRGLFDVEAQDPIQAKGFPEPVPVYRVRRAKARPLYHFMRGIEGVETRMVGRDLEFQQLQHTLSGVIKGNERAVITVIGEAGLGKSRLLFEFEKWIDSRSISVHIFKGNARPETKNMAFGLLRALFVSHFDIQDNDDACVVWEKIEHEIDLALPQDQKSQMKAHFIGQLLGFDFHTSPHLEEILDDAQQLHDRALVYLGEYARGLVAQKPVVVFAEDIHWADDSSLDALNRLVLALPDQALLLVAAARPSLLDRHPQWGAEQVFHKRLDLEPLSKEESHKLVGEVLQRVEDSPAGLREILITKAEGNPFYMEELVKMLIEDRVIEIGDEKWHVQSERLIEAQVPPTLTELLQARLDGLPADDRTILQRAAVVGRVFWDDVLRRVSQVEDGPDASSIEQNLAVLLDRELIYQNETSAFSGTIEHIFKHALMQEVVYESVLKRLRRVYHALVADWLLENFKGRQNEFLGLIADHFERAGNHTQACKYAWQAGQAAAKQFANEEAVAHFTRALRLASDSDLSLLFRLLSARERVYDLLGKRENQAEDLAELERLVEIMGDMKLCAEIALRRAHFFEMVNDYPAAFHAVQLAIDNARSVQDMERVTAGTAAWGRILWYQGEIDKALNRLNIALDLARKHDLFKEELECLIRLGIIHSYQDKYEEARACYENGLAISRKIKHRQNEAWALNNLGLLCLELDEYSAAKDFFEKTLFIRREMGYRLGEGSALTNLGIVAEIQGDYIEALGYYDQALKISYEINNFVEQGWTLNNLGFVNQVLGRYDLARGYYLDALHASRQVGNWQIEGNVLANLSLLSHQARDDQEALSYSRQALQIAEKYGAREMQAEILTNQGHALVNLGFLNEAKADYQQALSIRDELGQQNKMMESLAGLARVHVSDDNIEQALVAVEEILTHLKTRNLEGTYEPARVYLTCYQVLQAGADPRSIGVLETAYGQLRERGKNITDQQLHRSFLENVPWHREIMALWENRSYS